MLRNLFTLTVLFCFLSSGAHAHIADPSSHNVLPLSEVLTDDSDGKDYYSTVRKIIKNKVYQLYAQADEGEVVIVFKLNNKGIMSQLSIVEERTKATPYLRNLVLTSAQSIGRFPKFPKALSDYNELDFNIVVNFKIKEE